MTWHCSHFRLFPLGFTVEGLTVMFHGEVHFWSWLSEVLCASYTWMCLSFYTLEDVFFCILLNMPSILFFVPHLKVSHKSWALYFCISHIEFCISNIPLCFLFKMLIPLPSFYTYHVWISISQLFVSVCFSILWLFFPIHFPAFHQSPALCILILQSCVYWRVTCLVFASYISESVLGISGSTC